jgi:hypothetical protein
MENAGIVGIIGTKERCMRKTEEWKNTRNEYEFVFGTHEPVAYKSKQKYE